MGHGAAGEVSAAVAVGSKKLQAFVTMVKNNNNNKVTLSYFCLSSDLCRKSPSPSAPNPTIKNEILKGPTIQTTAVSCRD